MSSNPAQGAQPQAGAAPQRRFHAFRPEELAKIPSDVLKDDEKKRYADGLTRLWKTIDGDPQSSQAEEARKRLADFSKNLQLRIERHASQQRASVSSQGQSSGTAQPQAAAATAAAAAPGTQQRPPQLSQALLTHVNNFKYVLPSHLKSGTPEATQWLTDAKNRYAKALMMMESCSIKVKNLENMVKERNLQKKPLTENETKDYQRQREAATKSHGEAKKFVDEFRRQQTEAGKQQAATGTASGNAAPPAQPAPGTANPQAAPVTTAPTRPPMTTQPQPSNNAMQTTQTVNAAIEAARNQQMGGGRPQIQPPPANTPQSAQQPAQTNVQQTSATATPTTIKQEGGGPPVSQPQAPTPGANQPPLPAQQAIARQQSSGAVNSPQTAGPQSATSAGPPRALTQSAALLQAARTYSSSQASGTPNVMASHSHPPVSRETSSITSKSMQIPKQLPEKLTQPPQAVPMATPRPTISGGPTGAASGVVGQPALQKPAGFTVEGDGDRVMNKKKLDELVRQVCGGQFEHGEGLSPELEESMLQVADEFVDNIVTAACKCAKARGAKYLEIRDLQLVLERNYNIRIPGYASDELRTVRKFQPAQGWVAKMSAVQAAKVTGGKSE